MARVYYDLAAKAGKYQDRDGKDRHRYQKMGKLIVEDDGRMWGVLEVLGLETTFSVFPQQDKESRGGGNGGSRSQGGSQAAPAAGRNDLDDDIPF